MRYLYEPGELEGQQYGGERRRRSTDPIQSVDVYKLRDRYIEGINQHFVIWMVVLNDLLFPKLLQPIQDP